MQVTFCDWQLVCLGLPDSWSDELCVHFFLFLATSLYPRQMSSIEMALKTKRWCSSSPVSHTVLCEHSVFSASYLYASLPVTRRPQQGPEASGWPWSAACCLPAGGAAPRPCKAACLRQAGGGVPSWGWSGPTDLPLVPSLSPAPKP